METIIPPLQRFYLRFFITQFSRPAGKPADIQTLLMTIPHWTPWRQQRELDSLATCVPLVKEWIKKEIISSQYLLDAFARIGFTLFNQPNLLLSPIFSNRANQNHQNIGTLIFEILQNTFPVSKNEEQSLSSQQQQEPQKVHVEEEEEWDIEGDEEDDEEEWDMEGDDVKESDIDIDVDVDIDIDQDLDLDRNLKIQTEDDHGKVESETDIESGKICETKLAVMETTTKSAQQHSSVFGDESSIVETNNQHQDQTISPMIEVVNKNTTVLSSLCVPSTISSVSWKPGSGKLQYSVPYDEEEDEEYNALVPKRRGKQIANRIGKGKKVNFKVILIDDIRYPPPSTSTSSSLSSSSGSTYSSDSKQHTT